MTTQSPESRKETDWLEKEDGDSEDEDKSYSIDEYDLVSIPNDFNTRTVVDFIDSRVVLIPGFQRNYVWDIKRASRLIESIIMALPVPQIFLYEQGPDRYLVIDGQQRLMSIYYFVKGRFPRKTKLAELRLVAQSLGAIPSEMLENDEYFTEFRLNLPEPTPSAHNKFNGRTYSDLEEDHQRKMNLRPIRHIIVRQVGPPGDQAMYEIFNRLNSGGVILTPQEIRRCAFDSDFYHMLDRTNTMDEWRKLVGIDTPDLHMRDVEILLRGFAMLINKDKYRPSMVKFLNQFSLEAKSFGKEVLEQLQQLLSSFLISCQDLPVDAFHSAQGRFSPAVFESVFVAICSGPYQQQHNVEGKIELELLNALKADSEFNLASQSRTTSQANVHTRLERARIILGQD